MKVRIVIREYVFASIGRRKVIGRIEKVVSRSDLLNQDMDFVSVKKTKPYMIASISCIGPGLMKLREN